MNRSYNGAIEQYRYALRFQNNILNNHAELRCISPVVVLCHFVFIFSDVPNLPTYPKESPRLSYRRYDELG